LKPGTALFPSEAKPEPLIDALLNQVSGAVCILRLPDLSLMGMSAKASQLIGCSASNWAGLREDLLARGDGDSAGQTRTFRCHRQHHALFQLNYVSRLLAYGEGFCLFLTFTEQSTYPAACVLDTPAQDEYLRVLTAALQKSRGAILLTDAQGTVTYANEAYKQLTGYEDSDIIGKQPSNIRDVSGWVIYRDIKKMARYTGHPGLSFLLVIARVSVCIMPSFKGILRTVLMARKPCARAKSVFAL
jgi:PAS domain-containing protein